VAVHCPECSFVNAEGANYCQKCGAYLGTGEGEATTATYRVGETGEIEPVEIDEVVASGAGLVIRSGGGRVGETFPIQGERMSIGRRPESEIFLDDVTVSRRHALFDRAGDTFTVSDVGSLNGTYVNRQRVDSHRLEDGDELQIGKYKLSYLVR